jgi:hypothetical protein
MIPRHVAVKLREEAIWIIEAGRYPAPSGWLVNAAKLDLRAARELGPVKAVVSKMFSI